MVTPRASRHSSLIWATPPSSSRARRAASAGESPAAMCLSTCFSRWKRSSSSSSCSTAFRRNSARSRNARSVSMAGPPRSLSLFQHLSDGGGELAPGALLHLELLAAAARQRVVLGAAVVVGRAPLRVDEAPPLEGGEGRVERALLDLEHAARDLVEPLRDRPAVPRPERQGLEDEEVERPLWQFDAFVAHG